MSSQPQAKAGAELLFSVLEEVLRDTVLLLGERLTPNETEEDLAYNDRSKPLFFVLGNGDASAPCQELGDRARHISSSNTTEDDSERVCDFIGVAVPRAHNL